jgi:glycosidase
LFYGEEIGITENLEIPGRLSVRTPMQWSADRHAGFSTAPDGARLCRQLPENQSVNVADQRRDPDSLLSWIERLIHRSYGLAARACAHPAVAVAGPGARDPGRVQRCQPRRDR